MRAVKVSVDRVLREVEREDPSPARGQALMKIVDSLAELGRGTGR